LKGSDLPAERYDASGVNLPTGKFRFSSVFIISMPTAPVAPAIATCKSSLIKGRELYWGNRTCQLYSTKNAENGLRGVFVFVPLSVAQFGRIPHR